MKRSETPYAASLASSQLLIWESILGFPFNIKTPLPGILISFWKEFKINSKTGKLICYPWQVNWFWQKQWSQSFHPTLCKGAFYPVEFIPTLIRLVGISYGASLKKRKSYTWLVGIKLLSWKIEGGWAYMLPRRETPHWQQNYAGEWGEKVVSFGPMSWNTNIVGGQFLTRLLNPDLGRQCFIAQLCVNWVWNGPLVVTINYPFRITNG